MPAATSGCSGPRTARMISRASRWSGSAACPVAPLAEQDAEVVERGRHPRPAVALEPALEGERLAVERLGLVGLPSHWSARARLPFTCAPSAPSVSPSRCSIASACLLEPLGLRVVALLLGRLREPVERPRDLDVLLAVGGHRRVERRLQLLPRRVP